MARVVVSHAGDDLGWAEEVRSWLVADGHEVFLDRNLRDGLAVGEEWEQRLHERLRWADAVVCVVTTAFLRSVWCAAEVGIARSRGSRVLPVLAEAEIAHPLLPTVQHVDAVADPEAARAELVAALARVLPLVAAEPGWWTAGPVLPGRDPVAALARELAHAARRAELPWTVSLAFDPVGRVLVTGGMEGHA